MPSTSETKTMPPATARHRKIRKTNLLRGTRGSSLCSNISPYWLAGFNISAVSAHTLSWSRAIIQPDVHPRRFPIGRLVEDVQVLIAIEVGQPRFVKAVAGGEHGFSEIPLAVAVENECLRLGIVRLGLLLGPLGHLRSEN